MRSSSLSFSIALAVACGQPKDPVETGYPSWTILPPPTSSGVPSTSTTSGLPTTGTPTTGAPTTGSPTTGTPTTGTPTGTPTPSVCEGLDESACVATTGCSPADGLRDPCLPGPPNSQYAGCHSQVSCAAVETCAEDPTGVVWQIPDACIPDGWTTVSCPPVFSGGTCP